MANGKNLRLAIVCATLYFSLNAQGDAGEAAAVKSIEVVGTQFVVALANGQVIHSAELIGATLNIATEAGAMRLRIDAVEPDPGDQARSALSSDAVLLHTFFYQTPEGDWRNLCEAGPDERRQGFPLEGRARKDGTIEPAEPGVFEITCTSGAQGKCVRFGYHPWEKQPDGSPMRSFFNSCIRLVRADYSGDGRGTTRDGQLIDIYDFLGVQSKGDDPARDFEAGWSPEGAVCVRHVRVKENASLAALEDAVTRLKGRTGTICTEEFARAAGAVLFNRSPP
jgi:ADYC domain